MDIVYRAVGEAVGGAVEVGPEAVDSAGALEYGRLKLEDGHWYSFEVEERYTNTKLPMPRPQPASPPRPDIEGRVPESPPFPVLVPPPFLPAEILGDLVGKLSLDESGHLRVDEATPDE